MSTQDTVTITYNATGQSIELPVYHGSHGPSVVDIRVLNREMGLLTYDPGFMSTASCQSAITFIDGDEGVLLYRGYPVDQLAEKSSYLEVCYLLTMWRCSGGSRLGHRRLRPLVARGDG